MLKLLVVDDEVDICGFVKNFFKARNFEVKVAYDGKGALDIIKKDIPDIVLLDLEMPVMGGLEVLKQMENNNTSKVIVVSALEDTDIVDDAKRLGAVDYITKPLLLEQLERTVINLGEQLRQSRE